MVNPTKRISLWSGPRNISTTLMYSFGQREDTQVFDEPLYGYYLKNSRAKNYHPGAEETINTMETKGEKVVEMMLTHNKKPVLFFKNMTHHLLPGLDRGFLKELTNIILTRDPAEMLPSYAEVVENPTMEDVGYKMQVGLLEQLQKENVPVIVIDSKAVLLNPKMQLKKICAAIGIPFEPKMLHWKPGVRPEDGSWAKYWYANIHQSTGFNPYTPKTAPFPEKLKPLLEECLPYYEKLVKIAL
ncbi:sulfotransferase-like domain-containing protein [Planktosalinus lacus]|uniref:Branched chain amino acid aminotransferase n=1 Tax=Planktosalinus lacus TaxID=1526573 RepID=A0A8J2V620_9FLAO|nr:sulfotransferase family protein [Planktosalinus lacus]GGD82416.1 branched chain amino acid aminotransferase [Planktosalinus lacus]